MAIEIIEHPAQSMTFEPKETFQDFANRIYGSSKIEMTHRNGAKIEFKPGMVKSAVLFDLERFLTPMEFYALKVYLENAPPSVLPEGLVKRVATAIDFPVTPELPTDFADGSIDEESEELVLCLDGNLHYLVERRMKESGE